MIRSKVWLAVVVPTFILVLSGCLNISADISLNAKAEATGSFTIDVPKQVAAMMGITSAESLESTLLESENFKFPRGNSVEVKETDTSFVMTVEMVNAPLTEDEMKIVDEFTKVNGKTITLKVALDENVDAYAISEAGNDSKSGDKIVIIIVGAIIVASVLAGQVRKRAKNSGDDIV